MTRRVAIRVACATAVTLLAPGLARASEADAFENKIKPVSGQLYTKAGKIELQPFGLLTFNDAFFQKWMLGLRLGYHFNEYVSVSVAGSFGGASATGSTNVCPAEAACAPASREQLFEVPGFVTSLGSVEVAFAPVYGKLNVFAEQALHFDLSVMLGADAVRYRDVLSPSAVSAAVAANQPVAEPGTATTLGGHAGVGMRIFLARSFALQLAVRDVLYRVSSLDRSNLQTQLMANLGFSFFIPVSRQAAP